MKNKTTDNNNFLAKWLIDDISQTELEDFEKSSDFEEYNAIKEGVSKLKTINRPEDEDIAYKEFKKHLKTKSNEKPILKDTDNFLGKWLNNDLEAIELKAFEESEDYSIYSAITDGVSKLKTEDYTPEVAYAEFKQKLENTKLDKSKVIKFPIYKAISFAVAACLVFAIGLAYTFTNETHETQFAQLENITLPDNSKVTLNAKSKLTYNKILFALNRKLNLEGEAYFEVEKGSNFTVETTEGTVEVLGTKFNVISRSNYFVTKCFEGKVRVSKSNDKDILTQGEEVRHIKDTKEKKTSSSKSENPSWMNGVSEFNGTPLKYILQEIENHFNVSFDTTNLDSTEMLYSGSFTHNDLDNAIQNVCLPLGIDYTKNEKSNVITLKMH